ncbi:hypothetical protein HAX54_044094 [Datura stramonium]|uniref:Uncharacterized protein n=1 Tax=Datura stramonium TaxID=4076 RepID=A0ABS8W3E3_DATST|nr:hypothetical protein [Datura stramonium]
MRSALDGEGLGTSEQLPEDEGSDNRPMRKSSKLHAMALRLMADQVLNMEANELGFAIRVKSSWTKQNKEKRQLFSAFCNCEGFKTMVEANSRRKETRDRLLSNDKVEIGGVQ